MFFWQRFDLWGERPAISCEDGVVTYRQFERECAQFSGQLPDTKSLVLIESDNSTQSILALYASLRRGHAVVLCDRGNETLKSSLCERYAPELVYEKEDNGWHLRRHVRSGLTAIHEDLALLLTTSGSTGEPKCARISWDGLQSNTDAIASFLSITETENTLLLLPVFYCYGLSILNTHLAKGACVHTGGPGADNRLFPAYLREKCITSFSGVPYTYELLERNAFRREILPDIRYIAQAGGRLRPDLVTKYDEWAKGNGSEMYVMYGQAEATARIAYMDPALLATHPDCIGRAIQGGRLSLVDTTGRPITGSGREGELEYTGPNVMLGYADSREDLGRGREISELRTGDLAIRTDEGLFKITGRKRRFCKIYGRRLNLDDIEQTLWAVDPSAACASNDDMLYIGSKGRLEIQLVELARRRFGIASSNIITRHYSRLPLLASGKIDYHALTADLLAEIARRAAAEDDRPVIERLLQVFRQAFPDQNVSGRDSFVSLGGDSLNYVVISIDLEHILKKLPERWEHMTLHELSTISTTRRSAPSLAIETGIALRAVSILAIVLQHNDLSLGGGGVILMLVAGRNFARFHLQNFLDGVTKPAFVSIARNILLPYWAILLYFNLFYDPVLVEPPVGLSKFFLIGNYFYQQDWLPFPSWFIQTLVQLLVFFAATLAIPPFRKWARLHTQGYLALLFSLALLYRIIDEAWLMELYPTRFADQRTAWEAWVFVMGMICYNLRTQGEKHVASSVLLVLTLIFWADFWSRIIGLAVGGLLLIWKHQVKIPEKLVPVVQMLASASLFIYMTHLTGIVQFLEPFGPIVATMAGLLQGIALWYLFRKGGILLSSFAGNWRSFLPAWLARQK